MRRGRVEGKRWWGGPGGGRRGCPAARLGTRSPHCGDRCRWPRGDRGRAGCAAASPVEFADFGRMPGPAAVAVRVPAAFSDPDCSKRTKGAAAAAPASHGGAGASHGMGHLRGAFCANGTNTPVGVRAARWARRDPCGFACRCGVRTNAVAGGVWRRRAVGGVPGAFRTGPRAILHESDECRSDADRHGKASPAKGGFPMNEVFVWTGGAASAMAAKERGQPSLLRFPVPPPLASHLPAPRPLPPTKSPEYYPISDGKSTEALVR